MWIIGDARPPLFEHPVMQPQHAVHLAREALVMRGDKRGGAFLPNKLEKLGQHGFPLR